MNARSLADFFLYDRAGLWVFGFFFSISFLFFGRGIAGSFDTQIVGSMVHDPSLYMWCLVWWPYAIRNRLNPFLSGVVWAPGGVNLAWATSMPGTALLAMPLTRTLGPVATHNVLCLLFPALAGWSGFLLCRHLVRAYWPSVLAGYLFGFSPYILGRTFGGQFVLTPIWPIPILVLLTLLLIEHRVRPRSFVAVAALLLAAEFSFSMELFATTTLFGAFALALAFLLESAEWRTEIRQAVAPITASYALALLLLAPYLYYVFAFGVPHGPMVSPKAHSSDPLNFLIPTTTNLVGANGMLAAISEKFSNTFEASAYIAPPLGVIIFLFARSRRRTSLGKFMLALLGVIGLTTLGPKLHVAGHMLFALPWKIAVHLPLLESALPARFTLYMSLVIALIVAIWMADQTLARSLRLGMAGLAVLFTLPNPHAKFWITPTIKVPPFFTSGEYRKYLARNETVVILPYGWLGASMLWQAETQMYFRMAGGHTGPAPNLEYQRWPALAALYGNVIPDVGGQLKAFLAAHDVSVIIVDQDEAKRWKPLISTLDLRPISAGGVLLYRIPATQLAPYRNSDPIELERSLDRTRFETLLVAASRYLSAHAPLESLTPLRAEQMGLLPAHWAAGPNVYTRNGLWLGPFAGGKVSVGVVGSWEALKPLIDDYRADATAVYFPYPRRLEGAPRGDTFMRKLVMVFEPAGLKRAAARASAHGGNSSGLRDDVTVSGAVSPEASRRGVFR